MIIPKNKRNLLKHEHDNTIIYKNGRPFTSTWCSDKYAAYGACDEYGEMDLYSFNEVNNYTYEFFGDGVS